MMTKLQEEAASDEQAAYRKGRGCPDHLVTIQIMIEKLTAVNQKASFLVIDYSKAIDTPSHAAVSHQDRNGFSSTYRRSFTRIVC